MPSFASTLLDIHFCPGDDLDALSHRYQPGLKLFKVSRQGGESYAKRFTLSGARSTSTNRTEAIANAAASQAGRSSNNYKWIIPQGEFTGEIDVIVKDMEQSSGDGDAAAEALLHEVETGVGDFGQSIVDALFSLAGKTLGSAVYATADHSLTFSNKWVAGLLMVGDRIEISANDGTDPGHTKVGLTAQVISSSASTGKVIVGVSGTSTAANPGSWVNSTTYFVFRAGFFNPSNPTRAIIGMGDYFPTSWSTSISALANVTRNTDERLAGIRTDSNEVGALTFAERIKFTAGKMMATGGAKPMGNDAYTVICSVRDFTQLERDMTNNFERMGTGTTEEGYDAIYINTVLGRMPVVCEPAHPDGQFKILCKRYLEIRTPSGNLVGFMDHHGTKLIHKEQNEYEIRTICYPMSCVGNPGHHGLGPTPIGA